MIRTGIFGGSFNPIHNGHIALAKQLLTSAGLDEVWLMVSPQNPLKHEDSLLDDRLRLDMAQRALVGIDGVKASDYELHLPKPSYTWTTLQSLSRDYPNRRFTLLLGGDNWARFERWWHWKDILRHYDVVVYPRDNHPGTIQAELLPLSSTDIRQRVLCGESISGMVPKEIEQLVIRNYTQMLVGQ
jgi:nicotinate-nucleotide adenylyltransferase